MQPRLAEQAQIIHCQATRFKQHEDLAAPGYGATQQAVRSERLYSTYQNLS